MKIITRHGLDATQIIEDFKKENDLKDNEFAYEVIQEAKKGFLGIFGRKKCVVKFKVDSLKEDLMSYMREFLIFLQISAESIEIRKDKRYVHVELTGVSDPGFLIGKDGVFMTQFQYLLNITFSSRDALNRQILFDVEEYKKRQKISTIKKVKQLAQQAITTKKSVTLDPMSAAQRKIVHQAIQNMDEISTMTLGDGPNKRIVLNPIKKTAPRGRKQETGDKSQNNDTKKRDSRKNGMPLPRGNKKREVREDN